MSKWFFVFAFSLISLRSSAEEVVLGCVDCFSSMSLTPRVAAELFPGKTFKWVLLDSHEHSPGNRRYMTGFPEQDVIARIKLQPMADGITDEQAAQLLRQQKVRHVLGGMDVGSSRSPNINRILGFPDNSPETSGVRLHKAESFKVAGPYAIPTHSLKSVDEAIRWIQKMQVEEVTIKPDVGVFGKNTGFISVGDESQLRGELKQFLETGESFLLQPKIVGRKLYANTYTYNGVTKIVGAAEYYQIEIDGKPIYYLHGMLDLNSPEVKMMQEAVNFVVPAHGVENGPAHPEFIIDEKTGKLYLLEFNGRVAGAGSPTFDAQVYGTSQLHLHLLRLLNLPQFEKEFANFPRPRQKTGFMLIVPSPGEGSWDSAGLAALRAHPSFFVPGPQYEFQPGGKVSTTRSMDTAQGVLHLVGSREQVRDAIRLFTRLYNANTSGARPSQPSLIASSCPDFLARQAQILPKMRRARDLIDWEKY